MEEKKQGTQGEESTCQGQSQPSLPVPSCYLWVDGPWTPPPLGSGQVCSLSAVTFSACSTPYINIVIGSSHQSSQGDYYSVNLYW